MQTVSIFDVKEYTCLRPIIKKSLKGQSLNRTYYYRRARRSNGLLRSCLSKESKRGKTMVICEYCGKQADASLGTCPSCGAPLPAEPVPETTVQTETPDTSTASDTAATAAALIGALAASKAVRRRELMSQPHHPVDPPPKRPNEGPDMPVYRRPSGPSGKRGPGGHPGRK